MCHTQKKKVDKNKSTIGPFRKMMPNLATPRKFNRSNDNDKKDTVEALVAVGNVRCGLVGQGEV
jgi:hypothetical protein